MRSLRNWADQEAALAAQGLQSAVGGAGDADRDAEDAATFDSCHGDSRRGVLHLGRGRPGPVHGVWSKVDGMASGGTNCSGPASPRRLRIRPWMCRTVAAGSWHTIGGGSVSSLTLSTARPKMVVRPDIEPGLIVGSA
jgi:hypothetical protein